ncbi:MAG: hypothetical protein ACKV2O_20715 [Acidimicrobiales bacterium]
MSAPSHVPVSPVAKVRTYSSPPWRDRSWMADRPGDLDGEGQPHGERFGVPGPDQGYAYKLVGQFTDRLTLTAGEHLDDAIAGVVAIATKRSALFGRAPVVHDLAVGFRIFGFLNDKAPAELVALRSKLFTEVSNPHHYPELRAVVDAVPEATLRLIPAEVTRRHAEDWRSLLALSSNTPASH